MSLPSGDPAKIVRDAIEAGQAKQGCMSKICHERLNAINDVALNLTV